MQKKVLAICENGTNRSVKLCEYLKEYGIDCVATGHSNLAKEFGRHYSQAEGDFDLAILLDDNITIRQAEKIINDVKDIFFQDDLFPELIFAPIIEKENYEKDIRKVAKEINQILNVKREFVMSEKYFKKLQEDEEERKQFREAIKKAEERGWL